MVDEWYWTDMQIKKEKEEMTNQKQSEFLPCPFCGCKDIISHEYNMIYGNDLWVRHEVSCEDCEAELKIEKPDGIHYRSTLHKQWNSRHNSGEWVAVEDNDDLIENAEVKGFVKHLAGPICVGFQVTHYRKLPPAPGESP